MEDAEARELRQRCTRFLGGHGRETAAAALADVIARLRAAHPELSGRQRAGTR